MSKYYCRTIPDIYFFEVGFVTGADMFIRREAYEKCGLFDPDFFMYYEDAELCARYRKYGFKSVIIKKPSIVHLEGASNKNNSLAKRGMVMKSMFLYFKKNLSTYSFRLFKVLFKIIDNVSTKLMSELPIDVPNKSIINIIIILKIDFFLFVIFIWISSFCYFL